MNIRINESSAARQAVLKMLETGHCAQAMLKDMHVFLEFDDIRTLLLSTSGLAGGLGYQGAACGALTCGAMILGLLDYGNAHNNHEAAARRCGHVNRFVHQFEKKFGNTQCSEIIGRDFNNNWQVRKHVLIDSMSCIKLTSESVSLLAGMVNRSDQFSDNHLAMLINEFSNHKFHCADSVVSMIFRNLNADYGLSKNMLISLNGGMGYCGSTCTALMGGCIAIGVLSGGDNGQGGVMETLGRMIKTFTIGSRAFKDAKISPAGTALMLCSELVDWFENRYSSTVCREITNVDFENSHESQRFFSQRGILNCIDIATETAAEVEALFSQIER